MYWYWQLTSIPGQIIPRRVKVEYYQKYYHWHLVHKDLQKIIDIKSIKKAARKGVEEELIKRVNEILSKAEIKLDNSGKILWKDNPIARLKKGNDYLNPDIDIIADESLNEDSKLKLIKFLNSWLSEYINEILGDLIKLTKYKIL